MTARVALLLRGLAVLVAVLLVVTLGARHVPVVPDLVLVLVVAWALLRGPVAGAAVGLAAGWLLDLVPPGSAHLGVQALTYAVAGAFAGRVRLEGPVAAPRVALVALGSSAIVEGVGSAGRAGGRRPGGPRCRGRAVPAHRHGRRAGGAARRRGRARAGAPEVRVSRLGTSARDRRVGTHQGRFLAVVLLVGLGFAALVGRLGQVQLVGHDDFRAAASALDTRTLVVPALRGRILDREGQVLADNRASTVVTIERRVIADSDDRGASVVRDVASVLGLDPADLLGRTWLCGEQGAPAAPACWAGSPQVPVPLAEDVDPTRALSLVEQPDRFPGVAVESQPVRFYPRPLGISAAQVLGYLGPVRSDEVGGDLGLVADDLVGRAGLEQQYDTELRGVPGRTVVAVDARGLVTGVVSRTEPVPGRDLVTSLDARVQAAAERGLATQMAKARKRGWAADSGAVVVLDPRSGAVAALASAPAYDPNIWTGGISQADYAGLTAASANTPLLSRAIGVEQPPASTVKPASVVAAVRAGNPLNGTYDCPAKYRIGNRVFNNHETTGRGLITFRTAIKISCDTVFYKRGLRLVAGPGWLRRDRRHPRPVRRRHHRSGPRCPHRHRPAGRGRRPHPRPGVEEGDLAVHQGRDLPPGPHRLPRRHRPPAGRLPAPDRRGELRERLPAAPR